MMTGIKAYPETKESGLGWLGKIPKHWKLYRGKYLFKCIDIRSETGKEELLTVSAANGIVPRKTANVTMFKAESYIGYKLCWPNDLVINSLWAWAHGLGVSKYHGVISTAYGVYRPNKLFNPRFVHQLVRSKPFQWELQVRSRGIWTSRLQLTDDSFLCAPFPVPPLPEQNAVVKYLDYMNSRINKHIKAKQKLIKLLEEQKQAIIHEAVTQGLDPKVKMKPSGVECLGNVPAHWEILQVRRVISFITSGSRGWANFYSDSGSIFLQSGNLGRSMKPNLNSIQHVTPPSGSEGERTSVESNDVLVCITGALTGNVVLVDEDLPETAYVNQHVALLRPKPVTVVPKYLTYFLYSETGKNQFKTGEYGGTKQGLGLGEVKSVFLALPSNKEQKAICSHLDQKIAILEKLHQHQKNEIELIQAYQVRLTSDVVTGKLDVRDATENLPDMNELEDIDLEDNLKSDEDIMEEMESVIEETEA
ncbi:restriction endonuclease subunit S [Fibrobacterota bacterium]